MDSKEPINTEDFLQSLINGEQVLPEKYEQPDNASNTKELEENEANGKQNGKKKEGPFGVVIFEAIVAVLIAILYVFTITFLPAQGSEYKQAVKQTVQSDFTFSSALYEFFSGLLAGNGAGGDDNISLCVPADSTMQPVVYTGYILFPLKTDRRITDKFGFRTHPITGQKNNFHKGIDIAAAKGTPIIAVAGGTVAESTQDSAYGNFILIDHGHSFYTMYAHCDELLVQKGTVVRQGEVIAKVGTTGNSTGYHLHFAMKKDGKYFDPTYVFAEELNVKV